MSAGMTYKVNPYRVIEPEPVGGLRELDERIGGGLRIRLMYWDGEGGLADPETFVEVWEGQESPGAALVIPVAAHEALDAFWHPYAYAGR